MLFKIAAASGGREVGMEKKQDKRELEVGDH